MVLGKSGNTMENTSIVTVGKPRYGFSYKYFKDIQKL